LSLAAFRPGARGRKGIKSRFLLIRPHYGKNIQTLPPKANVAARGLIAGSRPRLVLRPRKFSMPLQGMENQAGVAITNISFHFGAPFEL